MSDLWRLGAAQLAARIRTGEVSVQEAARSSLDRLDAINPSINAVVDFDRESVLRRARQLDDAIRDGAHCGPLAGVPVTVKVNIDQTGFATTNGVSLQRNLYARSNSPVVDNLERAGAIIVGRTNTPAFSLRWFTSNRLHGRTINPRDPGLTPGGSSGGGAAAVAAGIGHLAHGTDIAGSIRYPAYACGVHGLRPSLGRVAAYNASSPERTIGGQLMAVSGPIARSIADLRLGLEVMAAADPRDPWWTPAPLSGPEVPRRVALCTHPAGLSTAPEIVRALDRAAALLRDAGWHVEAVDDLPGLREAAELQAQLWIGDGYTALADAVRREGDPGALAVVEGKRAMADRFGQATVARVLIRRATLIREWQLLLERYPVLLLPVSGELPFTDDLDLRGEEEFARVWEAQLTQIALPLLGLPALSVATGEAGATPCGVQIVAGRFREDLCLAAGEAIEAGGTPLQPVTPRIFGVTHRLDSN